MSYNENLIVSKKKKIREKKQQYEQSTDESQHPRQELRRIAQRQCKTG